jgi:hypothetical protein
VGVNLYHGRISKMASKLTRTQLAAIAPTALLVIGLALGLPTADLTGNF